TRELRNENGRNLQASFVHAAEPHSLKALLQELIPPLKDTGAPDANGMEITAGHGPIKRLPARAFGYRRNPRRRQRPATQIPPRSAPVLNSCAGVAPGLLPLAPS